MHLHDSLNAGHQKHGLTAITSFVEASLSRSADILAVDDFDEL